MVLEVSSHFERVFFGAEGLKDILRMVLNP